MCSAKSGFFQYFSELKKQITETQPTLDKYIRKWRSW
jgi:hypothetical protein